MTYQMRRPKGSTTPVQYPSFDSPAPHGWTVRRIDSDGVRIWELRENGYVIAVMKPQCLGVCDIAIMANLDQPYWVEMSGDYSYMTSVARRLYLELIDEDDKIFSESIHWDGDPEDTQPEVELIPWQGEPIYPSNDICESGL